LELLKENTMTAGIERQTLPDGEADHPAEIELLRVTERLRLRALVEANLEIAEPLHADDFQLINPSGSTLSKAEYLGGIASGYLKYLTWEPESIEVRLHGDTAVLRYQSHLEISVGGQQGSLRRYWHTDFYEKRSGHWQVVWSQATEIQ
jgi:hypothetical protein